jgi:predicted RNA binding protein YcfA (HicA-like mRNA interferase family)
MGRVDKTLLRMRAHQKGWRYDEVARILEASGFATDSDGGSHRTFKHPSGERVTLVDHGSGPILPVYVRNAIAAIDRTTKAP